MGRFGWGVVGLVVLGAGTLVAINWMQRANDQATVGNNPVAETIRQREEAAKPKPDPVPENYVQSGGILRPKQDIEQPDRAVTAVEAEKIRNVPDPGRIPGVKPDTNPNTRSVAEALRQPELAHRLISLVPPPKFVREEYDKDPEKYLATVEPGRIWQSAQAGPGVIPINARGLFYREILQGEKVSLEVEATQGAPVTFFSNHLGQFDNQLTVMTVRADDDGVARASFLAASGTRGEIDILASSPVHSGQARYVVNVIVPQTPQPPPKTGGKSGG